MCESCVAWSDCSEGSNPVPWCGNCRVDGAKLGASIHFRCRRDSYRSHTFDETQRCQLYQHDIVLIQLAALGFIKCVAAVQIPPTSKMNAGPQFRTVYLTVPAPGDGVRSLRAIGPCDTRLACGGCLRRGVCALYIIVRTYLSYHVIHF
jgi:hypothetical protein